MKRFATPLISLAFLAATPAFAAPAQEREARVMPASLSIDRAADLTETACAEPGVVFLPLDTDVAVNLRKFAMVPKDVEDPNFAEIVTASEREWIERAPCFVDDSQPEQAVLAKDMS